jgi:6,7-dimethyl-8-ribityllumazine synthase
MVKGISLLRSTASAAAQARLARFFSALGFAPGKGWEPRSAVGEEASDAPDASRGISLLAPLGNLEFIHGAMPPFAEIAIEVTSLDSKHHSAIAWFRAEALDPEVLISPMAETAWKARYFTAEPEPGHAFSFWAWIDPLKGKPVALEGDLSAEGMKFAIVVARWNAVITDRLLEGALDALLRSGADAGTSRWSECRVPGRFHRRHARSQIAQYRREGREAARLTRL